MAVELVHWHTCICKFFNKICAVQIFTQILWFWKKKNFDIYKKIPKHLHCIKHKFIHQISFSFLFRHNFSLNFEVSFQATKKIQKNIKVFVMLMYHNIFVNIFPINSNRRYYCIYGLNSSDKTLKNKIYRKTPQEKKKETKRHPKRYINTHVHVLLK